MTPLRTAVDPAAVPAFVAPLRPAGSPCGRVVAFPHAGAGPGALLPVVSRLPPTIEVLGVTLPGRERRYGESPTRTASDPAAVVAAIHAELAALPGIPTLLFGHSLGAALAAAVATHSPRHYAAAVLSALPGRGSAAHRSGRWSESELVALLRGGGAIPEVDLAREACPEQLLAVLRSDLTLAVRLVALMNAGTGVTEPVARVPTTVLAGAADEITGPPAEVLGTGHRAPHTLPGGHFYLFDEANAATVAGLLADELARAAAGEKTPSVPAGRIGAVGVRTRRRQPPPTP